MPTHTKIALVAALLLMPLSAVRGEHRPGHHLPSSLTNYYGIALGRDGKSEVNYKLGTPPEVVGELSKSVAPIYNVYASPEHQGMPLGRKFQSFNEWEYGSTRKYGFVPTDHRLDVLFSKSSGKVTAVTCFLSITVPAPVVADPCRPLLGVQIGDTEQSVDKRLGAPSSSTISGSAKTLVYEQLHVTFILTEQRVYGMRLTVV